MASFDQQYIEFYVDSDDYKYGNRDNPRLYFPDNITDVVGFRLISAEIPFSYDVINSTNNTFILKDTDGSEGIVTLTKGTYSSSTLATAVTTALNTLRVPATSNPTYTATLNLQSDNNYRFTFTIPYVGGQTAPHLSFPSTIGQASAADHLGFVPNTIYVFALAGGGTRWELVAPGPANITGPNYLYLNSSLGSLLYGSVYASYGGNGHTIARVTVNVNPGQFIYFENATDMFFTFSPTVINYLEFYLAFPKTPTTPISLNGMAFSLRFGLLRKKHHGRRALGDS
jgi:hypothetical protein